jgi:DNA (cytosine-5)-methyltransferase 1
MAEGRLHLAPICTDVREISKDAVDIPIDIIFGGFPCQDISVAGKGAGLEGERSGLFFEVVRLAKEIRPAFLFLENVPAIRTRGLDAVIQELTTLGYDCRWTMLSAAEVGAPHKRERWFCLAFNANHQGASTVAGVSEGSSTKPLGVYTNMAYSNRQGLEIGQREPSNIGTKQQTPLRSGWWSIESDVGRVAHGIPYRVDRIKRLGNAVVPAQAREAFKILMGVNNAP